MSKIHCENCGGEGRIIRQGIAQRHHIDPVEIDEGECPVCQGVGTIDYDEQQLSRRVMLCTCGFVLETPAKYAAHCAEYPEHFNTSEKP